MNAYQCDGIYVETFYQDSKIRQIRAHAVIRNFIKLIFYKIYMLASTFNYLGIYVQVKHEML